MGVFSNEYPPGLSEDQTYGSDEASITRLDDSDGRLVLNITFSEDEISEISENFSTENVTDFSLKVNSNNRIVKNVEDFSDSVNISQDRQAF